MPLLGRAREAADLIEWCRRDEAQFIAIYGRRRVGKTYLVTETLHNDFAFRVTGLMHGSMKRQLANFATALRDCSGEDRPMPSDWFEAFHALRDHLVSLRRPGKKIVFLDEMPWLDTPRSEFLTALEGFWNGWASGQHDIVLIVCGSASSWIVKNLFRNHGGLHNRVTRRMFLTPFNLAQCREFYEAKGIVMSRLDMVEAYMVLGGVPYYLDLLDRHLSLAQNIGELCFSENGVLRDEFDNLFASLFKNPGGYVAVVRALASKRKGLDRREIAAASGLADGGGLTRVLDDLERSGFTRRYRPFGRKSRGALYQLMDPFTLFYLAHIENSEPDPGYWPAYMTTSAHAAWAGNAFERVCLAHVPQIKAKLGIAGVITTASAWRSETSDPGAQIDLVLDRADRVVNLCEMKYAPREFAITKALDVNLRHKRAAFIEETGTTSAVHLTLVTTFGLVRNAYWGGVQSEVTAEDLFAPVP